MLPYYYAEILIVSMAPVAQLDRVPDYGSGGCGFDSCRARHFLIKGIKREVAQLGSAPGLGPGGRRFESCLPDHLNILGAIAQLGEHLPCTQGVSGSIPLGSTIKIKS
jgi:hypothetical protein